MADILTSDEGHKYLEACKLMNSEDMNSSDVSDTIKDFVKFLKEKPREKAEAFRRLARASARAYSMPMSALEQIACVNYPDEFVDKMNTNKQQQAAEVKKFKKTPSSCMKQYLIASLKLRLKKRKNQKNKKKKAQASEDSEGGATTDASEEEDSGDNDSSSQDSNKGKKKKQKSSSSESEDKKRKKAKKGSKTKKAKSSDSESEKKKKKEKKKASEASEDSAVKTKKRRRSRSKKDKSDSDEDKHEKKKSKKAGKSDSDEDKPEKKKSTKAGKDELPQMSEQQQRIQHFEQWSLGSVEKFSEDLDKLVKTKEEGGDGFPPSEVAGLLAVPPTACLLQVMHEKDHKALCLGTPEAEEKIKLMLAKDSEKFLSSMKTLLEKAQLVWAMKKL